MNRKQLLETIGAMKHEILDLLINQNMSDDNASQQTLSTINEMFKRLNLEIEDVIPEETLKAYFGGVDEATKALKDAGLDDLKHGLAASISSSGEVASAFKNHVHMEAIAEITDDTMLDLKAAIRTAKKNSNAAITTALDSVKKDIQSGKIKGKARKAISQKVAESFAKNGMTSFTTIDGKELPLDFYSQTVTRTNLKKANTKGASSRYEENGVKLFTVTGNTPTCDECAPLRGIVFSMDPDDDEFPYMNPEDIHPHPNCNCSVQPYVREYKSQEEFDNDKQEAAKFDPTKDNRSKSEKDAYSKQQALHRKNNYEKKRYADIKGMLGDDAPANLGAFKRMKKADSDNYRNMLQDYQNALKSIK